MSLLSPFWAFQLRASWRNLDTLSPPSRTRAFFRTSGDMLWRHQSATATPIVGVGLPESEKLTVLVLNHKRPDNVARIAQYTLRAGFVRRLIISNNSLDYKMESYVKAKDPRLVLIDQERPSGVGISFELAQQFDSRYYLRVDDDIFLHPVQLQWIYWNLRLATDRPHGIFGAALSGAENRDQGWPFAHRRNIDSTVEILNGLFAFTRGHLSEYLRLCALLGISDQRSFMNGEDIVLSFSGDKKPLIHNVGPIWECASASSPGVALHQSRPRFHDERLRLFTELEKIKLLAKDNE